MDESYYYPKLKLTENEAKMPLARFFDEIPLLRLPILQKEIIDRGPMKVEDAVPVERWLDVIQPTGYQKVQLGYCMFPDGGGYYVEYYVTPADAATLKNKELNGWFHKWVNIKPRSTAPNEGNLRYKLWCPTGDHWDHKYVNGVDGSDGTWAIGTFDEGRIGAQNGVEEISYELDLTPYGLTPERAKALRDAGCRVRAAREEIGHDEGHHLVLRMSRPCPHGGVEHLNREWIGYDAVDGKIVRDPKTFCTEEYLRNVLIHCIVEHIHEERIIPALYAEYHDKPWDAD